MADVDPGQNEETDVVDHLGQVAFPLVPIPADQPVAGRHLPRGGAPAKAGHQAIVKIGEILQRGADDPGRTQIMMAVNQVIPHPFIRGLAHHLDCQRAKRGNSAGHFRGVHCVGTAIRPSRKTIGLLHARRQGEFAFFLQGQQQAPAGHVLQLAVGLPPLPALAEFP